MGYMYAMFVAMSPGQRHMGFDKVHGFGVWQYLDKEHTRLLQEVKLGICVLSPSTQKL